MESPTMQGDPLRLETRLALMRSLDVKGLAPGQALFKLAPPTRGELAVRRALAEWAFRVEEPPGKGWERIDLYIRGPEGLGWGTADAITWKPRQPYTRNGMFAYCLAFAAAYVFEGLDPEIREHFCSSTGRLFRAYAKTERHVPLTSLLPGDVGIVAEPSTLRAEPQGSHGVLIERVENGLAYTIEANAKGLGPDGKVFEGVVRRTRPLPKSAGGPGASSAKCPVSGRPQTSELCHAYRWIESDFKR